MSEWSYAYKFLDKNFKIRKCLLLLTSPSSKIQILFGTAEKNFEIRLSAVLQMVSTHCILYENFFDFDIFITYFITTNHIFQKMQHLQLLSLFSLSCNGPVTRTLKRVRVWGREWVVVIRNFFPNKIFSPARKYING